MSWQGAWQDNWSGSWQGPTSPPADKSTDTPLERTRFIPPKKDPSVVPALRTLQVRPAVRTITSHEDQSKMTKFDPKDPDERDDFKLDWTPRLAPLGDTIETSTWQIVTDMTGDPSPLNIYDEDIIEPDKTATRVWLEGGTNGRKYDLLNEIVTTGGRTLQETVTIPVKHK